MTRKFSILLILALLLPLAAACSPTAAATATPTHGQRSTQDDATKTWKKATQSADKVIVTVVRADGSSQPFTLDGINALPPQQIIIDGQLKEGRRLMDLLTAAGVTDFTEIVIANNKKSVSLQRPQIGDDALLVFNDNGALKLTGAHLSPEDTPTHIRTITVK